MTCTHSRRQVVLLRPAAFPRHGLHSNGEAASRQTPQQPCGFSGATFRNPALIDAIFDEVAFSDANLGNADFRGALAGKKMGSLRRISPARPSRRPPSSRRPSCESSGSP
ncbi:pentapeptide repeat-containing protein [Actinomadura rupiterrae]|uniref:pentapeptide repeat-containing protein n=1 Tax=Actinomadura rupiterrae TaxID=559627 RepID=UPI003558402D